MLSFAVPFSPPVDDVQEVIKTQSGATCFLLNTACKGLPREEIRAREERLLEAHRQHQDAKILCTASLKTQERE